MMEIVTIGKGTFVHGKLRKVLEKALNEKFDYFTDGKDNYFGNIINNLIFKEGGYNFEQELEKELALWLHKSDELFHITVVIESGITSWES
jgi:hypothetical protein